MDDDATRAARIRALTSVTRAVIVPELALHLVTPAEPLWRADEAELERLGLPEPFWAFAWAGGQALARYVLDHPAAFAGRRVLDFGAGCAIEGLAARRVGAARVLAADVDPWAATAATLNAALNGLSIEVTTDDLVGELDVEADVVLVGDVLYGDALAARVRPWLAALAARGVDVWVGDPGRGHAPPAGVRDGLRFEHAATIDAPSDVDVDGRYLRATHVLRARPA